MHYNKEPEPFRIMPDGFSYAFIVIPDGVIHVLRPYDAVAELVPEIRLLVCSRGG